MYLKYKREKTLQLYDQCKSVSKVIQQLGYPTRKSLYVWIADCYSPTRIKAPRQKFNNAPDHPRHPSLKLKLDTIYRCFIFHLQKAVTQLKSCYGYFHFSSQLCTNRLLRPSTASNPLYILTNTYFL